jgi:hypothetical protein
MSVSLRDLRREDAGWLDTWLGACAASVGYERMDPARAAQTLFNVLSEEDLRARVITVDAPIGLVTYRNHATDAVIEFVGVQPAHARRGYGHAGAALVEEEMRTAGVTRIFAAAPGIHGIDVYFWIRLGYRPLLRREWPCDRPGVAWLARDLA